MKTRQREEDVSGEAEGHTCPSQSRQHRLASLASLITSESGWARSWESQRPNFTGLWVRRHTPGPSHSHTFTDTQVLRAHGVVQASLRAIAPRQLWNRTACCHTGGQTDPANATYGQHPTLATHKSHPSRGPLPLHVHTRARVCVCARVGWQLSTPSIS